jgi:hypothetical protein
MTEKTRVCSFILDPAGFVHATMADGADFELADAQEAVAATKRVAGGVVRPVLVEMRGVRSQTREARAYFAAPERARDFSAIALVVGSPVSRVIANFFLRFGSQPVPTRLFDDEGTARAWLREQLR